MQDCQWVCADRASAGRIGLIGGGSAQVQRQALSPWFHPPPWVLGFWWYPWPYGPRAVPSETGLSWNIFQLTTIHFQQKQTLNCECQMYNLPRLLLFHVNNIWQTAIIHRNHFGKTEDGVEYFFNRFNFLYWKSKKRVTGKHYSIKNDNHCI